MNKFYVCVEGIKRRIFRNSNTEFGKTGRPSVNEASRNETSTESDSSECTLDIESEAEDNSRKISFPRILEVPEYPPNYYQFSACETEFFKILPSNYWYDYQLMPLRIYKFENTCRKVNKTRKTKKRERMLTAVEACSYILNFTYYKIPVVNFIKICYQTLCRIPSREEKTLVNLIFANLKDKIPLNMQDRQLTKMTELIMLIKEAFLLPVNISYCKRKLRNIRLKKNESIFEYIARFQQLHTMILDYKININRDSDIDSIIEKAEFKHLHYFLQGIPKSILNQHLTIFPYNYTELNFNIAEIMMRLGLTERTKKEVPRLKKNKLSHLNKSFRLFKHAPTYRRISGFIMDENRIKIGMMKAKEASQVIPYFNGHKPLIYDFIKACLIAFSNTVIEEEAELVGITMSRLKGEVADSVKWFIAPSMLLLIKLVLARCQVQNDKSARAKICIINIHPTENIEDYIVRFKYLHIIFLCQYIFTNIDKPIKVLIELTETFNLIIFIRSLIRKSFIPNFGSNGFNDFLAKVINEYNVFQEQRMRLL